MPSELDIAFENATSLTGDQDFTGSVGMDFTVNTQITIFDLGAFDDGLADITQPITVGIFNVATEQLISQTITVSGTAGTQIGSDRFETLASALILNPGTYSVVAWGYDASMELYNQASGTQNNLLSTNSSNGAISFVGTGRYSVTADSFPTSIDAGPANRYATGTFEYSPLTTAYEDASGLTGNETYSGSLGLDFTVNMPLTIYDLGAFDNGQTNMASAITVGIYNVSTEQLISQLVTLSGTAGTQIGSSRFNTLSTPLVLNSGTYSVVAWGYDTTAEEFFNQVTATNTLITTNSDSGAISFVGDGRYGATAGAFPTSIDGGPADRYAAGSFDFQVTVTLSANSEATLNSDIAELSSGGADAATNAGYVIDITQGFALSSNITAVNLLGGSSLTINGGSATINGSGKYRGFFAYGGALTLNSLTLSNMLAQGGTGGYGGSKGTAHVGGGGGGGLGGALFVGSKASVTLNGVYFSSDAAKGGAGGVGTGSYGRGAGAGLGAAGGGSGFFGVSSAGGGSGVAGVGGYSGGSAAFYTAGNGANGAFGGGGGSDPGSRTTSTTGGNGGFGGGGGAGLQYQGHSATGGTGGFGAGSGGVSTSSPFEGAGGGGGLGAGGDIFVVQGGSLVINAGTLAQGTVTGGAGGTGGTSAQNGVAGSAFGGGIFLQGTQSLSFEPSAGQTTTVSGVIADQTGSGGTGGNAGAGSLVLDGAGTLVLSADNTYTGGTTIENGGTVDLTTAGAAGSGAITFSGTAANELVIQNADLSSNHFANSVTVSTGAVIDLAGLAYGGSSAHAVVSSGTLSVANGSVTDTIGISGIANGTTLTVLPDSGGGTEAYSGALYVTDEAQLNADIAAINQGGVQNTAYVLDIAQGFTLGSNITAIDLGSHSSLTINGGSNIITGANAYRGLFVTAGTVAIDNLTLLDTRSQGGTGATAYTAGGGGGAGLGGGLFVKAGADVALSGVAFSGDSAIGGNGGGYGGGNPPTYGGGGGLLGSGTSRTEGSSGAGAIGAFGYGGSGGGSSEGHFYVGGNGGFGGGGGGGTEGARGGTGGFGGGGGGQDGAAGFGGAGGLSRGGGGGLGAGGAIFIEQGGTLSFSSGTVAGGTVTGGTGGGASGTGEGLGSGIFIQGSQSITLTPGSGQTLTISNTIADSAGASGGYGGAGSLVINGAGIVSLGTTNTFTGGVSIQAGTLSLGAVNAAGTGTITFGSGSTGALQIGSAALSSNNFGNTIAGFANGETIDLTGLSYNSGAHTSINNGTLSVTSGSTTDTLPLTGVANGTPFNAVADGSGGTDIVAPAPLDVSSEAQLNGTLAAISSGGSSAATDTSYVIDITQSFTLNANIGLVNLLSGSSLTIDGGGFTINGENHRGLFAYAGTLAVNDLSLNGMLAQGGAGYSAATSGGGGAGLGGALFVNAGANVTLNSVVFSANRAIGGNGGGYGGYSYTPPNRYGSGGGMAGAGTKTAGGSGVTGTGGGTSYSQVGNRNTGGAGSFGGGGGGGYQGGGGGFGGGGGSSVTSASHHGGVGGFGGGGGGAGGAGGYGGGAGGHGGGGGGLGAGGAIFVRQGGALTIESGTVSGNSVGYGKGGAGYTSAGGSGAALGSGLFIQGGETIALAPAAGQTSAISDTIADSQNAGGGYGGAGALLIDGLGTVSLTGSNTFAGGITIDTGVLSLGNTLAAGGGAVAFAPGTGATLQLSNAALSGNRFGNTIAGFASGGTIDLTGLAFQNGATASINNGTLSVTSNGVTDTLPVTGIASGIHPVVASDGVSGADVTLCFCKGTMIGTPRGEVPVEELAVGELVNTWSGGTRRITWIGAGRVLAKRGQRNAATPVIVQKSAFADNVPNHDLHVTKGHAFLLDDVLIPVEFLVNHRSIHWDDRAQEVSLYHVELDAHDLLAANGAPAESYRDDGNRWLFRNANTGWDLPPLEPCAPVVTGGPMVDAAWRRLLDRAGRRPGVPLTDDPDLHLRVDGKRVDATSRHGSAHIFELSPTPGRVLVASRAAAPAELGMARDPRVLGVALRQVVVRQGTRFVVMDAQDARLADGFHAYEAEPCMRWTAGEAALPAEMFAAFEGALELVLHLGGTTSYPAEAAARSA